MSLNIPVTLDPYSSSIAMNSNTPNVQSHNTFPAVSTIPVNNPLPGIPWDRTPEYIALTQRVIPPGGPTQYTVPHPVGDTPATDFTSFVYGQRDLTIHNWPEFMYILRPTPEWLAFKQQSLRNEPPQKLDANGQPMWEKWPRANQPARPLLDFKALPDNISTKEDWWFLELWRRLHPMRWDHITMRMQVPDRTTHSDTLLKNRIQKNLGFIWHQKFFMLSWYPKGQTRWDQSHTARQVLEALANAGIRENLNTTRGLTPGLVHPHLGPGSYRIPIPNATDGPVSGLPRAGRDPVKIENGSEEEEWQGIQDADVGDETGGVGNVEGIMPSAVEYAQMSIGQRQGACLRYAAAVAGTTRLGRPSVVPSARAHGQQPTAIKKKPLKQRSYRVVTSERKGVQSIVLTFKR